MLRSPFSSRHVTFSFQPPVIFAIDYHFITLPDWSCASSPVIFCFLHVDVTLRVIFYICHIREPELRILFCYFLSIFSIEASPRHHFSRHWGFRLMRRFQPRFELLSLSASESHWVLSWLCWAADEADFHAIDYFAAAAAAATLLRCHMPYRHFRRRRPLALIIERFGRRYGIAAAAVSSLLMHCFVASAAAEDYWCCFIFHYFRHIILSGRAHYAYCFICFRYDIGVIQRRFSRRASHELTAAEAALLARAAPPPRRRCRRLRQPPAVSNRGHFSRRLPPRALRQPLLLRGWRLTAAAESLRLKGQQRRCRQYAAIEPACRYARWAADYAEEPLRRWYDYCHHYIDYIIHYFISHYFWQITDHCLYFFIFFIFMPPHLCFLIAFIVLLRRFHYYIYAIAPFLFAALSFHFHISFHIGFSSMSAISRFHGHYGPPFVFASRCWLFTPFHFHFLHFTIAATPIASQPPATPLRWYISPRHTILYCFSLVYFIDIRRRFIFWCFHFRHFHFFIITLDFHIFTLSLRFSRLRHWCVIIFDCCRRAAFAILFIFIFDITLIVFASRLRLRSFAARLPPFSFRRHIFIDYFTPFSHFAAAAILIDAFISRHWLFITPRHITLRPLRVLSREPLPTLITLFRQPLITPYYIFISSIFICAIDTLLMLFCSRYRAYALRQGCATLAPLAAG